MLGPIDIDIYIYIIDLALNNLQWLICHKTKLNQIIYDLVEFGFMPYQTYIYIYIQSIWYYITYNG